jgi:hypothetical protein
LHCDDSESDGNESEYDEGDSENGGHYNGDDPSSKGGPANGLRIMTMEELEEMEPGFAMRFDKMWERTFNKKKGSVLPIGDGKKQKVKNSAKRWAHDADSNSNPREYERETGPDPPRLGRHEPSSTASS